MSIHDSIRLLRESKHWSQEEMAHRLNMSLNGYARIERGETKLHLEKLDKIAQVFNIDVIDLITSHQKGAVFFMNEKCDYMGANYYGNVQQVQQSGEIEKLNLIIQHKDEIIAQKDQELSILKKLVEVLEKNQKNDV